MKGDDKMIKWSKNYLMGIDKFDEEHKELFRISDQIYNKVMERGDDAISHTEESGHVTRSNSPRTRHFRILSVLACPTDSN